MTRPRGIAWHPFALAAALTLANAAKPALVDDAAYLAFARHLAADPFHPYGFELFWYDRPQPAMEIVLPPALPYWLALGIALFGENLLALKLWLFPIAAILAYAARSLSIRFVPNRPEIVAAMLTVGPGALPFFNVMLDLPALAFELAALAIAVRGMDARRRWPWALVVGAVAALAMQTKYSVLGLPAILLALGTLRGHVRFALLAVAVGTIGFAIWEFVIYRLHGESHFLLHSFGYAKATTAQSKLALAIAYFGHLGLIAGWAGAAVAPFRLSVALFVGFLLAMVVVPFTGPATALGVAFAVLGGTAILPAWYSAFRDAVGTRRTWDAGFLFAWLLIETLVYLAVSPFPAGRRLLAAGAVIVLILARCSRIPTIAIVFGLVLGIAVAALDAWDANAERELPRRAAETIRERGAGTVHFIGHWGWQYYAERDGMKLVDPERTVFEPGDWLLLPVGERPNAGGYRIVPDRDAMRFETTLTFDDRIPYRTIPNLYASRTPFGLRTGPRLSFELYRIVDRSKPKIERLQSAPDRP